MGSHAYFTKRAWNVVQAYIERFSEPGDLILDPFGGSGVTAVEALILRRRAIHVDIAPLANLITWGVAVSPVDIIAFQQAYRDLEEECRPEIERLYTLSDRKVDELPLTRWVPPDVDLPPDSDVPTLHALFHRRSLIALTILYEGIQNIEDTTVRELYRLVFAATLIKTNLTFTSTTGRLESRGDSGIFRVYRYWVPKKTIELNVWEQFTHRYKGARRQARDERADRRLLPRRRHNHPREGLRDRPSSLVADESVDYIYTDPPYGAHIAYLDLRTMWHAWLGSR